MWNRLRQPLSAKGTFVATASVLLIAACAYGLIRGTAALWHRQMLERSIPAALAGMRSQREALIEVIESYKKQFGYYPPMFTAPGSSRGILNPLCYELVGVRFDPGKAQFHIPITKDGLTVSEVQKYFNTRSFSNCLAFPSLPTNFLADRPLSVAPLTKDVELFGVGVSYTDFIPEAFWEDYDVSAWRYLTNPAEHNPGKFDIWVEIDVVGKHFVIGNWTEVK